MTKDTKPGCNSLPEYEWCGITEDTPTIHDLATSTADSVKEKSHKGKWCAMVEDASRRSGQVLNQARRGADRTSAPDGQAMDGLSVGLKT